MPWIGGSLDDILCEQYERTVGPDNCVRFGNLSLQIPVDQHRCHYVKANLTTYLGRQLKLPVNEKKSQVAKIDQCVFLGFTFRRGNLRTAWWRVKANKGAPGIDGVTIEDFPAYPISARGGYL